MSYHRGAVAISYPPRHIARTATGESSGGKAVTNTPFHSLNLVVSEIALLRQLKWSNCQTPTSYIGLALATSSSIHFFIAGWGTLSGSNHLEPEGIAKADRVIGRCGRKTKAAMKVQLLMRRRLVCRAEINLMLRTTALGESAGIFDIGVPGRRKLPIKVQAGLARQIPPPSFGWPHKGEHSSSSPALCQQTRPRQLDGRIITMTGYQVRSRGKAHGRYERNVKSASCRPKLMFEAHGQITKTGGESGRGVVVKKVVRGRKTELGLAGDSKSHGCLWEIEAAFASIAGLLKPILKLQAATRDDDTRTCDLRPVCGNRVLRIGAASLSTRLRCSHYDRKEKHTRRLPHAKIITRNLRKAA